MATNSSIPRYSNSLGLTPLLALAANHSVICLPFKFGGALFSKASKDGDTKPYWSLANLSKFSLIAALVASVPLSASMPVVVFFALLIAAGTALKAPTPFKTEPTVAPRTGPTTGAA